jgi:Carboxypeptidase regulatory-like domain
VKRILSQRFLLICALMLTSSPLSAQTRKLQPFTVSGIVLDTRGKPLKGASVQLRVDFVYGRASVTTGANGRYIFNDLPKGTYRAEAYVESKYAAATVCQRLAMPSPDDYDSFSVSQGAERNFRWQLTGKVGRERSYFGATILIYNIASDPFDDTSRAVEFRLTPSATLFDGSKAAVIVKQAPLAYPSSDDGLYDVPLGLYKLTAVLITKSGGRVLLNVARTDGVFKPEIDVVWESENRCGTDSGVKPFFVQLERRR